MDRYGVGAGGGGGGESVTGGKQDGGSAKTTGGGRGYGLVRGTSQRGSVLGEAVTFVTRGHRPSYEKHDTDLL